MCDNQQAANAAVDQRRCVQAAGTAGPISGSGCYKWLCLQKPLAPAEGLRAWRKYLVLI